MIVDSSGPMLDPSAVAQLAQPFKRLGQDRIGSQNGHGLGLSIVAAVAAAHEGSLELQARPEGGLRVQITLPGRDVPATRAGHAMRVLVVEDMPRHANRIAEGLRDQGMAVDVAYDGHEAIAKVNLTAYDVVLLDRDLPGIHGDQLCQLITHTDDPPMILMLTAAGAPGDRVKGLALGADDYLAKPFHFPELVLRIRALARRKPTARRRILQAAGIELDQLTGTVTRDGRTIKLATKERAVLEALLKASPAPLSTEQLLEQAWDENVDPFTNTVKVTIARLRRKLGQPDVIHTTPGHRLPNHRNALSAGPAHADDPSVGQERAGCTSARTASALSTKWAARGGTSPAGSDLGSPSPSLSPTRTAPSSRPMLARPAVSESRSPSCPQTAPISLELESCGPSGSRGTRSLCEAPAGRA